MTDPSTGTPLTRRAARAAAESARSAGALVDPALEAVEPVHEAPQPTRAAPLLLGEEDADDLSDAVAEVRHAARRRARRIRGVFTLVAAMTLLVGGTVAVTAAVAGTGTAADASSSRARASPSPTRATNAPPPPAPTAIAPADPCAEAAFASALAAHDTEAAVKAAGGGGAFREAVVSGAAACVKLNDPSFTWVVVNKQRPYSPKNYLASPLAMPAGVRSLEGGALRADAAAALSSMVAAAAQAAAGEIALDSGHRSYRTQVTSYGVQVSSRGPAGADLVSARPGYSEHQSGLAADLVACTGRCGALDKLAGTPQDGWLLAHSWEYGWIVRYEAGHTAVTGYDSEPWHFRFIGVGLAKAYHDGGFHTLEEFFGLPAAPTY